MKLCIECEKNVEGMKAVKIREDNVISAIRKIKRALGASKENELYVCEEHLKKHIERRKSFQKSLILFGIAAVLVFVLGLISMILSGSFNIVGFIAAVIISIFLILFAIVFKYTPDVASTTPVFIPVTGEKPKESAKPAKPAEKPAKRKSKKR